MAATVTPREHVVLAPHTTMRLGGPARFFVEAGDERTALDACGWSAPRGVALFVLGGGSNIVVADEGVPGLVLKVAVRGRSVEERRGAVELTAAAGEPWDDLVRDVVERGWAGFECLSGIPGLVGATPIQNVGAYGQEVGDTLLAVRALDTRTGRVVTLDRADCGLGYRDSLFKSGEPGRHVVLAVRYRLTPGGPPTTSYTDVARDLEARGVETPTLVQVRQSVLAIRRAKSMVLDPEDPNRRSCGSFFLNPIVTPDAAARAAELVGAASMPRWTQPDGRIKLSAAWLIERAGFERGLREGAVGLSTRHTLAIVAQDGACARDVVALARRLRDGVLARSGIRLVPEPALWGFAPFD